MEGQDEKQETKQKTEKNWGTGGGMYKNVKVPVHFLTLGIIIGIAVLTVTIVLLAIKGSYRITFETSSDSQLPMQSAKYGDKTTPPDEPEKIGYTFSGWYKDINYQQIWNFKQDLIKGHMTLYAAWSPNPITVRFDLNGGTYQGEEPIDHISVLFDSPYGVLPAPKKEGHTFLGWLYGGMLITSETKVTMNGEHILTASWEPSFVFLDIKMERCSIGDYSSILQRPHY